MNQMEEDVARERIEPGAGTPAQAEAERVKEKLSRREFVVKGGIALGLTLLAAKSYPVARAFLEDITSTSEAAVSSGHKGEPEFVKKQEHPETIQMPVRSKAYEVNNGETWKSVAEEHGLSVNLLAAANPELSLWKQPEIGATLRIPSPEEGLEDLQAVVEFQIIKNNLDWEEAARLAEAGEKAIKILGEANIFERQEVIVRVIKIGKADEEELAKWKKIYGDSLPWGVAHLKLGSIYLHPNFLSPANFDLLTHNVGHEIGHILTQTRHEDFGYPDGWENDPAMRAGNAISHYLFPLDRFAEQDFLKRVSSSHIKTSEGKKKPE